MKKLYRIIVLLLVLSVISTAVLLILSPDVIPAHYNASGQVDRFGSKYEQLIFPGFSVLMTVFLFILLQYQKRRNAPETEQKILLCTLIFSLVLFLVLEIFFGIAAISYSGQSIPMNPDIVLRFIFIVTGVLLICFGNLMPKARRNAFFGLRTKWSMANDAVWQKSQRFGGISAVVCGLLLIILTVIVPYDWAVPVLSVLVFLWILGSVAASYWYWKTASRQ